MSDLDKIFMRAALKEARVAADQGEVPVGAVITVDGAIVARAGNRTITDCDPTAHAEIVALRAAALAAGNYRLPDATLYVTIEPCTMCAGALVHARVGTLVFGTREPRAGAIVSTAKALDNAALNHRIRVVEGVLSEQCGELLKRFFRARRDVDPSACV